MIKDLQSGQMFRLDEQKYFLCQSLNGQTPLSDIQTAFHRQFQQPLALTDLEAFLSNMKTLGLLETCPAIIHSHAVKPAVSNVAVADRPDFIWSIPASSQTFRRAARLFRQFCWLGSSMLWAALPALWITLSTLGHNGSAVVYDLTALFSIPFGSLFLRLHATLITLNLLTHLLQGLVLSYYGGKVSQIGIRLNWGFFPIISVALEYIEALPRRSLLWVFGTPLLLKIALLTGSTLLWYNTRLSGTSLHLYAVVLMIASWLQLVIESSPFWLSSGYLWMVTFLRLPQVMPNARLLWEMLYQGRSLPPALTWGKRLGLWGFGLLSAIASTCLLGYLVLLLSHSLALLLQPIFGASARFILLSLFTFCALRHLWNLIYGAN